MVLALCQEVNTSNLLEAEQNIHLSVFMWIGNIIAR